REGHGVTRPGLEMLPDGSKRSLALAGQDPVEDGDMALFARRRAGRQLERLCPWCLGLVTTAHQLLGARERDVSEREAFIGRDCLGEGGISAGCGGHQAVDAANVGVTGRLRRRAEFVAVAIFAHSVWYHTATSPGDSDHGTGAVGAVGDIGAA